jgi:hypothetical protein
MSPKRAISAIEKQATRMSIFFIHFRHPNERTEARPESLQKGTVSILSKLSKGDGE